MFDFFRRHTRFFQIVLFPVILLSFGVFGIQSYSRLSGNDAQTVAKVAGQNISQTEWDAALRDQLERARQQMPNVDPKLFDTPEMRRLSLEALVRERVQLVAADRLHLTMSDERLQRQFATDPQFASLRNPDGSVSTDAIGAMGMSSEAFAERLRQDLSRRQVLLGISGSAIAPSSSASDALDSMYQQRQIQVQRFDAKDYASKVVVSDADIAAYYKNPLNVSQFLAPEQSSVEYVMLDLDALKKEVVLPEEDVKKYYAENVKSYTAPEERQISDILVRADKAAPKAERDKARARAETILAEVNKAPANFADIARKNSDDKGSAEKGGDLGFIGRNMTVKAFEDAAFALKPGQTSGVIDADDGFHVIRVTASRGGETRSFESLRPEIEAALRTQLAQKKFSEAASEFTNMVYEQPDSLKPVVDKWKLSAKTAQNVTRVPAEGAAAPLNNPKFLDAMFSRDALDKKRNTEAIEVGPNLLASGRVLTYAAAHRLPLADVTPRIRAGLVATRSAELARAAGVAQLAALRKAPDEKMPGAPEMVSRATPREVPRPVLDAALRAPVTTLPAFVGVDLGEQGYAIAKVLQVAGRDPVASDPAQARSQYAQAWGDAEGQAYYAALKSRLKVEIKPPAAPPIDSGASAAR